MLLASIVAVFAGSVRLAWDANTETDLAGYIMYYGVASRTYTNAIDVGNVTTGAISNLVDGTMYYFAVTAYNTSGLESDFSNEVIYPQSTNVETNKPSPIRLIKIE